MLTAASLHAAEEFFPGPDWKDEPSRIASTNAVVGGEVSIFIGQTYQSFNYYLDMNPFSYYTFPVMFEPLISMDPLTLEYVPCIANKWSISEDKKTFTFWIDEQARWSDGKPVTARDVLWTFDAIMNPTNMTGVHKVSLERFERPELIDERTIRFTAREVHWLNLSAAGGIYIMPQHVFEGKDFNKINFEFPVVSGLYRLGKLKEGVFVKLERRDDWWQKNKKSSKNIGNFQTLTFRSYAEYENAFEAFKKGIIDIYPVYASRFWANETFGPQYDKNWIIKQRIYNHEPTGFQGFAMNMRRDLFKDLRVRQALAYLLDREKMNRTMMYNQYAMLKSYYEDLYSAERPCENREFYFNKEKARALLKEAGWKANPATGILEKDGRPFAFKFLTRDASSDKFANMFSEDLKDVGIRLEIETKDWSAWAKDMDEYNYDMTWMAWGAVIFKNPENSWFSKEASRPSGQNITGFSNPEVDELIEKQKTIFDVAERHEIARQIDKLVSDECPYILLWYTDNIRLLYWNKFGTPPTVLSKYDNESGAWWYWWYDEDSAADLKDAMKANDILPGRDPVIRFDEQFRE